MAVKGSWDILEEAHCPLYPSRLSFLSCEHFKVNQQETSKDGSAIFFFHRFTQVELIRVPWKNNTQMVTDSKTRPI